jgi:DNA polymerase I-like protein with 3'-5' exonuclease and polymerase domains
MWLVIGCIHDEIIIEAPISLTSISAAAQILHDSIIDAGKMYLKDVPVVVNVAVVGNWWEK